MSDLQRSSIPDTLVKYVDAKGGLATLAGETASVMFSKPSDLNDPFEFLPSSEFVADIKDSLAIEFEYLTAPFLSATADQLKHEIELDWFVTSLSSAEQNVRMWSQYGEAHKGMCITFDLSKAPLSSEKEMMRRVDYSKRKRVDVSGFNSLSPEEKGDRLKQAATQKGRDWEHEEEIRWFLRDEGTRFQVPKKIVGDKMRAFVALPHTCIRKVTVGYHSSASILQSVLELRKMHRANWKVAKAIISANSFQFTDLEIC